jgi:hypothetical protein
LGFTTNGSERYLIDSTGVSTWSVGGSTAMTLNSTGLGVGYVPSGSADKIGSAATLGVVATGSTADLNFRNSSLTAIQRIRYTDGTGVLTIGSATGTAYPVELGGSTSTRAVTIDASGNVGVSVTPSAWGAGTKALEFPNGSVISFAGYIGTVGTANSYYNGSNFIFKTAAAAARYDQDAGQHKFYRSTNVTPSAGGIITFEQAMTLDASGNLLVGRTSVAGSERLCVEKDQAANEIARFRATHATDPYGLAIQYTANISTAANDFAAYYVNATTIRFGFRSNGGMANYQANNVNLSDSRTKTDIKPLASYWNKIKALELVTFKYNDQSHSDDNIGLIAQQVESVAPEFVDVDGFGKTPEDGVPLKTIYTTDLYHASIKALQEAMARIEVLEAKLA